MTDWRQRAAQTIARVHQLAKDAVNDYRSVIDCAERFTRIESLLNAGERLDANLQAVRERCERELPNALYRLEAKSVTLFQVVAIFGDEFSTAALGLVEFGIFTTPSAHHAAQRLGDVVPHVSSAIVTAAIPGFFKPGVETPIPPLCDRDDLMAWFSTATAAIVEWPAEVELTDRHLNRLTAMLDQESARAIKNINTTPKGDDMTEQKLSREMTLKTIQASALTLQLDLRKLAKEFQDSKDHWEWCKLQNDLETGYASTERFKLARESVKMQEELLKSSVILLRQTVDDAKSLMPDERTKQLRVVNQAVNELLSGQFDKWDELEGELAHVEIEARKANNDQDGKCEDSPSVEVANINWSKPMQVQELAKMWGRETRTINRWMNATPPKFRFKKLGGGSILVDLRDLSDLKRKKP